jgi:hypothetical protein
VTPRGWRGGLGQAALVGAAAADVARSALGFMLRSGRPHQPHAAWSLATGAAMRCCTQWPRQTLQPSVVGACGSLWELRPRPGGPCRLQTTPPKAPAPGYGDLHFPGVLAECPRLRSRRTRRAASAACMAPGARGQRGVRSATATVALLPIAEPGKRGARPRPRPRPALGSAVRACVRVRAAAITPFAVMAITRARVPRRARDAWYF